MLPSRYGNRFLFDWSGADLRKCLARLDGQAAIYRSSPQAIQRRMRVRALFVAALTLNATAIWTARLLERGRCSMSSQRLFFRKRWRREAGEWGDTAKSAFARALSGFSLGADGVCVDRHLARLKLVPSGAPEQWKEWFAIYQRLYGPGEMSLCARWHGELLDWIAYGGRRPSAWK